MKAAVLHEVNQPLVIEDVEINKPGPREVLIRTAFAGLCHSDLHFIEGLYPHPLPVVLGHESAGIVEQVGSEVHYVKKGDHVITCLSVFCGTCDNCTTGRPAICTDTSVKLLPGKAERLKLNGQAAAHLHQPLLLRRDDAGARECGGEDPRRLPARPRGADRLRRHHRLRRGGEHGQGRARRDGGRDRLRRRRHGRHQRRGDRRRGAHHRRRHQPGEAAVGDQARRHRPRQSRRTATPSSASRS